MSYPDEEDAKLRPVVAVRVEHVERLRVPGPHDAIEVRAHVRQVAGLLPFGGGASSAHDIGRQHAGACRHRPQELQDREVALRGLPAHGVADLTSVDVGRPQRLVEQPGAPDAGAAGAGGLLLALERDAQVLGAHLLHEPPGLHGELQQQHGHAPGRLLHRQRHPRPAVPEQRPRRAGRAADVVVPAVSPRPAAAVARDDAGEAARRREDREGPEQRAHSADGAQGGARGPRGAAAPPLVGRRRRGERDRGPRRGRRQRRRHGGRGAGRLGANER